MRGLGIALLVLCLGAAPVSASGEALLGSAFADAYAQFAPLAALYRSFGDHLFGGSEIIVPVGLDGVCQAFLAGLSELHERWVVQAASDEVETLGAVVRLRVDAEGFCTTFALELQDLAKAGGASSEVEDRLVAERFFVRIHEMDDEFASALDAALRGAPDGEPRWSMAVSFATRVLLETSGWKRVAENTAAIFYGSPDASSPPFAVPDAIRDAMASIVALVGRDLGEFERAGVRADAATIYVYFVAE